MIIHRFLGALALASRRGGSLSLGISIPLFDRGTATVAEQRASIQQENARLALANQRQAVALEVRRAYLDQQSARDQLAAAKAQLDAARPAVDAVQKRYPDRGFLCRPGQQFSTPPAPALSA